MKKILTISLCAALVLGLSACGAPSPVSSSVPSISVMPPTPESVVDSPSSQQEDDTPPIPADAAMYRGTVTSIAAPDSSGVTALTLEQAEGTDFGAPTAKFAFTADTRANFTPEQGQYLEVYYGVAPGKAHKFNAIANVLTAIKYHSAEMVNYNGYVSSITAHPDKPNQGWIMMVPTPPDSNSNTDTSTVMEGSSGSTDTSPIVGTSYPNEIRFNYDKDKTNFYLNFDEIKVGDHLNIFQSGAMTMSIPPQSFAIEVRKYSQSEPASASSTGTTPDINTNTNK